MAGSISIVSMGRSVERFLGQRVVKRAGMNETSVGMSLKSFGNDCDERRGPRCCCRRVVVGRKDGKKLSDKDKEQTMERG